jgi:glycosyltransferase involved in cell wall biosynthesis
VKVLFVHQNFPGQFKFLAPALALAGHEVVALTMQKVKPGVWNGIRIVPYAANRSTSAQVHPWVSDFETKAIRGDACMRACVSLQSAGFEPDVIIAHPGWGESMFVKLVWPKARLGIYCEFYYRVEGADLGFDPEFGLPDIDMKCRLLLKNVNNQMQFHMADAGVSPTQWQASTFPSPFRERITVIHDGIDTDALSPKANVHLAVKNAQGESIRISRRDQILTFVNRNLEPYRGYHVFMRALPELLARCPELRVLIVGGNDVSYGARPGGDRSWRDVFAHEVRPKISDADWGRVHFLGNLPYSTFQALLGVSTVHVYWTYPFVLSWSLMESMAMECAIVASDTQPLHEVIKHDFTGRLVPFFDGLGMVQQVVDLLGSPSDRQRLGQAARRLAVDHYDLKRVCLPRQLQWVSDLAQLTARSL